MDEYIYGRNPVLEAIKSAPEKIDTIYISKNSGTLALIMHKAKRAGIVIKQSNDKKLTEMTGTSSHQGVAAAISYGNYISLEELMDIHKEKGRPAFIILCDEIEDPHNLGAIIRTAECCGADGVIIPKRRSVAVNATVFKTSAGAANYVPVAKVTNLTDAIKTMKESGIWIYGTDMEGKNYTGTDLTGNVCLCIGSEGKGLGKRVKDNCDFLISLPMAGKINSLNASVAAAVFMYETVRQRNK